MDLGGFRPVTERAVPLLARQQAEAAATHSKGSHLSPAASSSSHSSGTGTRNGHDWVFDRTTWLEREEGHRAAGGEHACPSALQQHGITAPLGRQLCSPTSASARVSPPWRRKPRYAVGLCLQGALYPSVCTQSGSSPAMGRHTHNNVSSRAEFRASLTWRGDHMLATSDGMQGLSP